MSLIQIIFQKKYLSINQYLLRKAINKQWSVEWLKAILQSNDENFKSTDRTNINTVIKSSDLGC